ncbi:MAG: hypothetical protein ACTS6P_01300 [Candidatus Hodgkinia cicadicola]
MGCISHFTSAELTPSEDIPPPCQLLMICSPWTMIITITKCPTLRRVKITNPRLR